MLRQFMATAKRFSWGGAREGAGRKPVGDRAGVPHRERPAFSARFPIRLTMRLLPGLPSLRNRRAHTALRAAFAVGCDRFGFRLTQYSIQKAHLHLIVEAKDRSALVQGVQGLLIRVAKALNRVWGRKGSVFADRYQDKVLRTPKEVRAALAFVLHSARRNGIDVPHGVDEFSSGCWFDGWKEKVPLRDLPEPPPVAAAHTWLLRTGWRRHGLISLWEVPTGGSDAEGAIV